MFDFWEGFAVNDNNGEYGRQLERRTFKFVIAVINYLKGVDNSPINNVLINQLSKSATSIGANYEESQGASSRKDFLAKVAITHRESRETNYSWRIFQKSKINDNTVLLDLIDESQQIRNILGSIVGKVRKSLNQ